jgi:hypothetical protein
VVDVADVVASTTVGAGTALITRSAGYPSFTLASMYQTSAKSQETLVKVDADFISEVVFPVGLQGVDVVAPIVLFQNVFVQLPPVA